MAYSIQDYITETYGPGQNLASVSGRVNEINRNLQQQANYARIPNAQGLEALSSDMIKDELLGLVPKNVTGLLGQQAAERGVARGPGMDYSPATSASYLRALGLTSLAQQQKGQENLTAAYARNPAAPLFDAGGLLMNQTQAGQYRLAEQELALKRQSERDRLKLERDKMQLEAQLAALRTGGGGGGGGISAPAARYSTGTEGGGVVAPYGNVFDTRGTVMTEQPWYDTGSYALPEYIPTASGTSYNFYTGEWEPSDQPYAGWGYQPTSSGTMYMGTTEGYTG